MSQSYGMEIVIVLKGWTEVAEGDKIPFGQVPLLTLEVQCASTPPQDSASTLCQNLPLADVKVVDMSVSAFVASPDWLSAFDKMHNVTVMEVRGELLRGLPEALCAVLPSDGHSSPRMVLPSLRVLKLDSARLTEGDGIDSSDSLLHSLSDCFMLRFEYGMEIEELYLTDCTNTCEDDVEFLEEVVVDVFWDGYEFYEQDEEEEEENYSDEDYYDDYDVNIYDLFDTDYDVFGY
ncbi:hypothetical protein A0H81_06124 [Grifola frondosa]|uniref:F-box domain-containing protein n=1 Tax=Grifola frondosa TaxID=5627 RepID=A0A1C7MA04_GRIFR|nr:hypothetical protein A0H81_06124 [Grifola frondosa]